MYHALKSGKGSLPWQVSFLPNESQIANERSDSMKDETRNFFLVILAVVAVVVLAMGGLNFESAQSSTNGIFGGSPKKAAADGNCPGDHAMAAGDSYTANAGCIVKGDVEVNGQPAHSSDGWGNLVACATDCPLLAKYGANVSNRTFADLFGEMQKTGCANNAGCGNNIHCWVYNGALTGVACSTLVQIGSAAAPPSGGPGCFPKLCDQPSAPAATPGPSSTGQPIVDNCEPEIPISQKRVVKKGCIVAGDVLYRPAGSNGDFKVAYDNRQGTGTVQQLDQDYEVWNTQGASVYPQDVKLADVVSAMKAGGCCTSRGCFDGVLDWTGNRLDK